MKTIKNISADQIAQDKLLTTQQAETVRETIITKAEAALNMRSVIPIRQVGEGTQQFEYHTLEEEGSAELISKGSDYPTVTMNQSDGTVTVPINGASFELYERDIKSAQRQGTELDTRAAGRASRQVAENENDLILNGDSDWGIEGVRDQAGSSISSSTSGWDSATVEEIQNDVIDMVKELGDGLDQSQELALVVPKSEYHTTKYVDGSVNRTARELILQEVDVFAWDPAMPDNTAVLMVQDSEVMEYVLEEDLNVREEDTNNSDVMKWTVRTIGAPVVYQSGGIVEMTGI